MGGGNRDKQTEGQTERNRERETVREKSVKTLRKINRDTDR